MQLIDETVQKSPYKGVHPLEKCVFSLGMIGILLLNQSVGISLCMLGLILYVLFEKNNTPLRLYLGLIIPVLIFLLIGLIPIFVTVQGSLGNGIGVALTPQGLSQGILIFLRTIGAIHFLYFIILTTSISEILYVMKKIKVPSLMRELIFLIYHTIFLLIKASEEIYQAQRARGGYTNLKRTYRSFAQLIVMLLIKTSYQGDGLYQSMKARGYQGEIAMMEREYSGSRGNWIKIIVIQGILISAVMIRGR